MRQKLLDRKRLHPSIFMVILWVNLLSIVMVSGFNYFVFHRISDNVYLKSFIQHNQSVSEMAFRNIDKQMIQSVLQISQLYFSQISENTPLLQLQEGEVSPRKVNEFVTAINRCQKSHPYVKSIDIYYEGSGTVVTGFEKVHFPESEDRFHQYLPWYREWKETEQKQGFLEKPADAYAVEGPVITYVEKISQPRWRGKSIILAVHLSPDSFGEYINEKDGEFTILTRNGNLLYDTAYGREEQWSEDDMLAYRNRIGTGLEDDSVPVSMNLGDKHVTVFHTVSASSGLKYRYRIEDGQFFSEYNKTKQIFFMNFMISIGFNLLMLALISYYNYNTYRKQVLNASKEAGIVIGQENRSFNRSLNMLTEEISVLNKTINSSKGLLFQSAVRSILLNKNPDAMCDKLSSYLTGSYVSVFFLYLSEKDNQRLSVEQLQEEYGPGRRGYNVLFATLEKVSLVAVLLCDENGKQEAEAAFIKDMDSRWLSYRMVSGLTFPMQGDGIWNSYKSTAEAARYCYIFTEEKWLSYEQIRIEQRKSTGSHLRLFEIMERDIKSENFLDFKSRLEGLVVSFKSNNYTIDYCSSTLRDLVALFYQIMQHNQLDMWVVFGYDIREYYKQISNIDEFHEWGNYLCEVIIRTIRQKKQSVDVDIKDKILYLIEENLEKNISLDFLSEQLHLRPDVTSRMFRQTMGKGYTEYMKERKLSRAIELMEEGGTIKDIAERLGYSSAQYFIKVFKESYGITPYQFKKNREKGE